jgi:predicted GNAT family N-acyltransferase
MQIEYIEQKPSVDTYKKIRSSVGWNIFPDEDIAYAIKNTVHFVLAKDRDEFIGMGRVSGDGKITFYISDIIVDPRYQKNGIGTEIMNRIMNYIKANGTNNAVVNLNAAIGVEKYYEQFGFWKRPTDKYGYAMSRFLKK